MRCRDGRTWQEGKEKGQNSTGDNRNEQKVHGAEKMAAERDKENKENNVVSDIRPTVGSV